MTTINPGLATHTKNRTAEAVAAIARALTQLRRELKSGEIKHRCNEDGILELKHADASQLAGLGRNFLNGPRHLQTTKPRVERVLSILNTQFADVHRRSTERVKLKKPFGAASGIAAESYEIEDLRAELEKVKAERDAVKIKLERVASHVHRWANELRTARAEIRHLKSENKPTIIPL
ncbi:hypothetical protein GFL38_11380 [Rhizobium leguminosarum bv. viciae]|uniref:hypothetical protein n=1 Tax=Rhizobium ruizarguesonis TaxID=2081791 RepID=UPI00143F2031|nr:hypothetical protein [Rhizobium ruizarguesonis]NKJ72854.1 hypothetical protein [Rhizobium leguminosarum bv. viciae]NKQ80535.1 hypothetical protein [Rhizobium ruizarguesonis]